MKSGLQSIQSRYFEAEQWPITNRQRSDKSHLKGLDIMNAALLIHKKNAILQTDGVELLSLAAS